MSTPAALAAVAAAIALVAAWELLGEAEGALARLAGGGRARTALDGVLAPVRAGRAASRGERRRLAALVAGGLLAGGSLLAGPLVGLALAAAGPLLAVRALAAARARRRARLVAAAPLVARAVADALAGGHSVRGAVAAAADGGLRGPGADELRAARRSIALGATTDSVLERLRGRAAHPAYDALVAAILLQRDSGGDLAGLLRRLAATLEDQVRAEADARSITAQARFSALLVVALPLVAAGLAEMGRPGYLGGLLHRPLTGPLLALSAGLQALAWLAIRRVARVR